MVLLLVSLGAAACNGSGSAVEMPEGGVDGLATDGPNIIEAAEAIDTADAMDSADAGCGPIAAPNAWATWVMPNPARSGLPNPTSYAVSASDNQVIDNVTGLVWQRTVDSATFTWDAAKQYCACLTIDGVAGWRLPSRIELASLADWTIANPSIDSMAFPNTPSDSFWTSSVMVEDPGLEWLVFFGSGFTSYADGTYAYRARCVRGQPSSTVAPSDRYTIAGGAVTDIQTKLTWQQAVSTSLYTWADANTYCAGLSLNGTDWRVPAIGEIQTIVDDSIGPSVDATVFPMTPSAYFWSSSVAVDDPSRVWTAFFANGSTYRMAMTTLEAVRCVR